MSRARSKTADAPAPRLPADPILTETDLKAWAGERTAAGGRKEALLGCVELLVLDPDGRAVEARVRGRRPLPYQVRVAVDGNGLVSECTCSQQRPVGCKHAVAALEALRFPLTAVPGDGKRRRPPSGRQGRGRGRVVQSAPVRPGFVVVGDAERTPTREERIQAARVEEIAQRRQRARRERARVRQIAEAGRPLRFEVGREPHTVVLRGPAPDQASCDCVDFAHNELLTCRHIERVRIWFRTKKKRFPDNLLSVWWRPREWVDRTPDPAEEIRVDVPGGELSAALTALFDEQGWLRNRDEPPARRIDTALAVARTEAKRRGWVLDVDYHVETRTQEALREERRAEELQRVTRAGEAWETLRSGLGFRLHAYQETGAMFLARNGRAFLADDMGLGKTVQAIAAALLLREVAGTRRALVVCPASLKHQWKQEIRKACGEEAVVVDGPRQRRLEMYRRWESGFLILNYELVLRDLEAIRATSTELLILDEAQRIKNWDTKTARAVKQLESPYAFVLTGTPLENRLLELHSLVELLHPKALGPRWRLLPYHAVTEKEGRVIAYEGLDVLRGRLKKFFLRRERRAVLDQLPQRTDNTFWTGMTSLQRRAYRDHAVRLATLLSNAAPLNPLEIRQMLKALTTMRILCNAYAQYAWDQHALRLKDDEPPTPAEVKALQSPKLEEFARVLEDLLDESHTKIVVFSQWERMLRLAQFASREALERRDLRSELFHGGLPSRARAAILESFRDDPEVRVLFSTDAGGLGLNLQESASIVVNLEVPWNPAVLEQRIGRVHRLGQRESVQVLHFVTRGALEERVRQVVESKKALFDGLLVDELDRVELPDDRRRSFVQRVRSLIGDSDG